jgi:hypothetical protein
LDEHGLEPDIFVEITAEGQADGREEIFDKAVEYLTGIAVK